MYVDDSLERWRRKSHCDVHRRTGWCLLISTEKPICRNGTQIYWSMLYLYHPTSQKFVDSSLAKVSQNPHLRFCLTLHPSTLLRLFCPEPGAMWTEALNVPKPPDKHQTCNLNEQSVIHQPLEYSEGVLTPVSHMSDAKLAWVKTELYNVNKTSRLGLSL